ncbi:MAG TPA: nicotinate phosphoribosyltransferase, partial [Nitrolancea sp.]|nr:nicotinate phosphoribosyltransferase [Nitrolancea sp.]
MADRAHEIGLATDLYQLTMGASYLALGIHGRATFSLFVRGLPARRSYLVAAGLEDALERLTTMSFDDRALAYLRSTGQIRPEFVDALEDFRFSGDVWAVPEGRLVFADEPLLEVQGSIIEAQLAETILVNALHYATIVATKAARNVMAAPGKSLVEFGLRRTPSIDAGLIAARSAYLAGFVGTSNVLAGERFGIPVSGTVAHSFIEIFPHELDAFRAFADTFAGDVTLLIDTYDTPRGARHAAMVAKELAAEGRRVHAVRLDSGDIASLSKEVRAILDDAGLHDVGILASGGLDEFDLAELQRAGAPIDAYGIGTRLGTSADVPSIDMVYKLVQFDDRPTLKLSTGKATLVGPKQVWRRQDSAGNYVEDLIACRDEDAPGADWEPLLEPVMRNGTILVRPSLAEIRERHRREIERMPASLLPLDGA